MRDTLDLTNPHAAVTVESPRAELDLTGTPAQGTSPLDSFESFLASDSEPVSVNAASAPMVGMNVAEGGEPSATPIPGVTTNEGVDDVERARALGPREIVVDFVSNTITMRQKPREDIMTFNIPTLSEEVRKALMTPLGFKDPVVPTVTRAKKMVYGTLAANKIMGFGHLLADEIRKFYQEIDRGCSINYYQVPEPKVPWYLNAENLCSVGIRNRIAIFLPLETEVAEKTIPRRKTMRDPVTSNELRSMAIGELGTLYGNARAGEPFTVFYVKRCSPDLLKERLAELKRYLMFETVATEEERVALNFERYFEKQLEEKRKQLENSIKDTEAIIESTFKTIESAKASKESYERELAGLSTPNTMMQALFEQFRMMESLIPSKYQKITFVDDKFIGITQPIFAEFRDMWFAFGVFRVEIDLMRRELRVYKVSETDDAHIFVDPLAAGKQYEHPHLNNHTPCLGNIAVQISEMLVKGEINGLFFTMYQYLKSYNDNSPYIHIIEGRGANARYHWEHVTYDESVRLYKASVERTAKLYERPDTASAVGEPDHGDNPAGSVAALEGV